MRWVLASPAAHLNSHGRMDNPRAKMRATQRRTSSGHHGSSCDRVENLDHSEPA